MSRTACMGELGHVQFWTISVHVRLFSFDYKQKIWNTASVHLGVQTHTYINTKTHNVDQFSKVITVSISQWQPLYVLIVFLVQLGLFAHVGWTKIWHYASTKMPDVGLLCILHCEVFGDFVRARASSSRGYFTLGNCRHPQIRILVIGLLLGRTIMKTHASR